MVAKEITKIINKTPKGLKAESFFGHIDAILGQQTHEVFTENPFFRRILQIISELALSPYMIKHLVDRIVLEEQETLKLRELHAIDFIFSGDIKIAPNGHPFVIEYNGENSGNFGNPKNKNKERITVLREMEETLATASLEATESDIIIEKTINPGEAENMLGKEYYQGNRVICMETLGKKIKTSWRGAGASVFTLLAGEADHDIYHRQNSVTGYTLQKNPERLEQILADKHLQKQITPEKYRVPHHLWLGEENPKELILNLWKTWKEDEKLSFLGETPHVVIKPKYAAHGDGITISDNLDVIADTLQRKAVAHDYIIEPFIPSTDIDGNSDACSRCYWRNILAFKKGIPKIIKVLREAYWRIPPGATPDAPSELKNNWIHTSIANKTAEGNEALSHPMSEEHYNLCAQVMKESMQGIIDQFDTFDPVLYEDLPVTTQEEITKSETPKTQMNYKY